MTKPEWGAMWFDAAMNDGAVMYWGARAVINRQRGIEIYRDRQSFTADDETDKDEFVRWINDSLIPLIEQYAKKYKRGPVLTSDWTGRFFAEMDDRNSGGYIYVGAWAIPDDCEEVAPASDYDTDEHSSIDRPMYCEQCRLYPRKCDGADCYYDYLEALTIEK